MKNYIIIPCYNEASRLKFSAFKNFIHQHSDYVLCFVNDGSTDNTIGKLESMQEKIGPQILICDLKQNGGKAEAVRQGMIHLLEKDDIQSIGFMDADLSTSFDDYKLLVDELTAPMLNRKMVFGSRLSNGENNIKRTFFRNVMSKSIGFLIKQVVELPIKDTQCGAKVFKKETASFCFKNPFTTRWLFDIEVFLRMKKYYGRQQVMQRIQEIPLKEWIHVEGSKITLKDSIRIPSQLMQIAWLYNIQPMMEGVSQWPKFLFLQKAS